VATSFTIPFSRCAVLTDPTLRGEIQARTESDAQTSSILRSIGRFGHDASIRYYEVTPVPTRRTFQIPARLSWSVTAVR